MNIGSTGSTGVPCLFLKCKWRCHWIFFFEVRSKRNPKFETFEFGCQGCHSAWEPVFFFK